MNSPAASGSQPVAMPESLSKSTIYREYHEAFTKATDLPLALHAPDQYTIEHLKNSNASTFCALMAKTNISCAACHAFQQRLEETAKHEPKTLKCFAGLWETAVPVRVGDRLVAFLHTGHLLLDRPDREDFSRMADELIHLGANLDLEQAENAYFATRVISREQYDSSMRLLAVFARQLSECCGELALRQQLGEPPAVQQAREIIDRQFQEEISLGMVAGMVNVSAGYFSELFKKATGMNFVEYVARVRVEQAKILLQNPNTRISEIAFEVGFQSLSQFNRVFKKAVGEAPREWRTGRASIDV